MEATLTPKQERFAQLVAQGKTQAEAYRGAFEVGASTKPETTYKRACELMAKGNISGRVAELRAELSEKGLWTRERSVQALVEAYQLAEEARNGHAMVAAVRELNAMHGFNAPQKHQHTGTLPATINVVFVEP